MGDLTGAARRSDIAALFALALMLSAVGALCPLR